MIEQIVRQSVYISITMFTTFNHNNNQINVNCYSFEMLFRRNINVSVVCWCETRPHNYLISVSCNTISHERKRPLFPVFICLHNSVYQSF